MLLSEASSGSRAGPADRTLYDVLSRRRSRVPDAAVSRPLRGFGHFVKRWIIPIVGGFTPVALIIINIAVYINDHVQDVRWIIAVAAFLSGVMMNSWVGLSIYRWFHRRWPDWEVMHKRNEESLLVIGMFVITLLAFLSALWCFHFLSSTRDLPNWQTLWYGALQILWPIALKLGFDRANPEPEPSVARGTAAGSRAQPAATPPSKPSGGYVPPGYLPPS